MQRENAFTFKIYGKRIISWIICHKKDDWVTLLWRKKKEKKLFQGKYNDDECDFYINYQQAKLVHFNEVVYKMCKTS